VLLLTGSDFTDSLFQCTVAQFLEGIIGLFLALVLFFLRIIEVSGRYTVELGCTVDHF